MVTDRLATAGLLAVLGMLYPRSYMAFLGLMFLDIFSHWFQMYSTFLSGSETHKARAPGRRAGVYTQGVGPRRLGSRP